MAEAGRTILIKMFHYPKIPVLLVPWVALLLAMPSARAGFGVIRDNAAFFSDSAKSEASRNIDQIERRFKKDLVIETFKEIPPELKAGEGTADKAALNRIYASWALKQARELRVNGVYILLTKEPSHLYIEVGNATQRQAFTLRDRDDLASLMLGKLRQKQYDEALLESVNFVFSTMANHFSRSTQMNKGPAYGLTANVPNRVVRSESSNSWGWIIPVAVGLLVLWLVVGIIRSIFRGGMSSGGTGMTGPSSGGGFLSSLLGGMFGAAAGMWLYDQFSGSHGSAWGADQTNVNNDDSGFGGQDTDYSGTGGDFNNDSGAGGDAGGGSDFDSGGGDFGGGDSGGGGDF